MPPTNESSIGTLMAIHIAEIMLIEAPKRASQMLHITSNPPKAKLAAKPTTRKPTMAGLRTSLYLGLRSLSVRTALRRPVAVGSRIRNAITTAVTAASAEPK